MRLWDQELLTKKKEQSLQYVSDGLNLWLDGVNNTRTGHDVASTVWEDLSGNRHDWTARAGSIQFGEKSCIFDGNTFLDGSGLLYGSSCSLEFVFKTSSLTARQAVIIRGTGTGNGRIILMSSGKLYVGIPSYSQAYDCLDNNKIMSFSVSSDKLYKSGIECVPQGTDWWGESESQRIGGRSDGSARLVGEIYSIRVYNRVLTKDEIDKNYKVDKARFNIS